jgi:gamma-glutamylcyclotransferase (GGCT)/AIG2-like uncharacterized protein YtfP
VRRDAYTFGMASDVCHLFVYGTLRPRVAGPVQQRLVADLVWAGPATVRGSLHDLGPYPALVEGPGLVHGDLLRIEHGAQLAAIDAYEECGGADPLYARRELVATRPDGGMVPAWAYVYLRPVGCAPPVAGGDYAARHRL